MQNIKHKIIGYVLGAVILVAGVMVMKSMISSKKVPERKEQIESSKLVRVIQVDKQLVKVKIPVSGKIESFNKIELYSEIGGRVLKGAKDFKEGISFRKGEVLLQMDSRDVSAAIVAQRSSFLTALTQLLPDLKLDYEKDYQSWSTYIKDFNPNKSIPTLPEIKEDRTKQFITARNIYNLYYNIKSQELKLSKYVIVAPFDGVLSMASVQYGSIIRPGQKLGELIQPNDFELKATINIKDMSYVKKGDEVTLFSNDLDQTWKGKVQRLSKNINPKTQTLTVFVAIRDASLKDGMYLNGDILGNEISGSMELPRKLLNKDNSLFAVLDSKLMKIFPKVEKVNESTVIVSGIDVDVQLLNESILGAYVGMGVQIQEAK